MKKIIIILIAIFLLNISTIAIGNIDAGQFKTKSIDLKLTEPHQIFENNKFSINFDNINSYTCQPFKPKLPCIERTEIFPVGTKIKDIKLEMNNKEIIPVKGNILTVSQPVLSNGELIKKEQPNNIILTNPYPEKSFEYIIGQGIVDNELKLIVKLSIYPAVFNPVNNEIELTKDIDISINYEESTQQNNLTEEFEYVIISADEFITPLEDFSEFKNNNGVTTKLVLLNEIYSGSYFEANGRDDPEKIKYFIKNAIEAWGTKYVLLVGGNEYLPIRYTHVYVDYNEGDDEVFLSDLYYADIYNSSGGFSSWDSNQNDIFGEYDWGPDNLYDEVDLFPDVYLGRIPCITQNELEYILDKIMTYETQKAWTKDWFSNIVTIGGDTIPNEESNVNEGEYVNNAVCDIIDQFIPKKIWDSNGRLSGLNPTGVQTIINDINEGCGLLDWAGHGAPWIWTTYPHNGTRQILPTPTGRYTNDNILDLNNGDKLPIVITGACSVGKFNEDLECFTYSFVKNPNGGGIASIGPSGLSWGSSSESTINYLEGRMQISLFDAFDDGAITFGQMWADGITKYIRPNMDGGHHKTGEQWQPFGDPTLKISGDSNPPTKPNTPTGPSQGSINQEYSYTVSTNEPDGEDIYYLFDWGDGTFSDWLGPYEGGEECETTHSWSGRGSYQIRVEAKDVNGQISQWSNPLSVSMPKSKPILSLFEDLSKDHPLIYNLIFYLIKGFY